MAWNANDTDHVEARSEGTRKRGRIEKLWVSTGRVGERGLEPGIARESPTSSPTAAWVASAAGIGPTPPLCRPWYGHLKHYGLALLLVAMAAAVRWTLADVLSPTPFLVFYLAWVAAAAFGGLGPGLLAAVASWLCVDLFFDTTPWHVGFDDAASAGRLVVLMAGGLGVSVVAEKMRRGRLRERRQQRELKMLARLLERERQILQSVMDGARNSHLVYLDRDFNFVRVNEAYAKTCGYTPEQMIGKNHFALYPHADNEAIFARVRDTGVPVEVHDKPFVFPDQPQRGTTYWDWTLTPIKSDSGYVEGLVFSLFETTGRKQAEEALRELNATLESKVAQRTAELQDRARQLQKLTLELTEAENRERRRLAEILHGDIQQILVGAKFHLGIVSARCRDDETSRATIEHVTQLLVDAISKSRSLSHELRPPGLAHSDLRETFEWLAGQMRTKHGLTVHVDVGDRIMLRSEPFKALLFKAAQELLFNAIKHAQVREARLYLRRRRRIVCLVVSDKGRGFDPRGLDGAGGSGLLGIRERVDLLGGRMKVRSAKGRGSTFLILVPDAAP
jgi:PAS domain S-box-containing protein